MPKINPVCIPIALGVGFHSAEAKTPDVKVLLKIVFKDLVDACSDLFLVRKWPLISKVGSTISVYSMTEGYLFSQDHPGQRDIYFVKISWDLHLALSIEIPYVKLPRLSSTTIGHIK